MISSADLRARYLTVLRDYLGTGDESSLFKAYECGRQAMEADCSLLDVEMLHHESLLEILFSSASPEQRRESAQRAALLLQEFLMPFEMARRGFQENVVQLQDANGRLLKVLADLEAANNELDAFSYSVSHDLRMPLRAIDGFSKILEEEYRDRLDIEAHRLISIIRTNTKNMGQLIDDLLTLSRTERQEMRRSWVDVTGLVRAVFFELTDEDSRAGIDFQLGELPEAWADASLLRRVWTNLLSNAIKFSAPRAQRIITVKGEIQNGNTIYTISDNGVGFDMTYADQLFSPFQRLHSDSEFPGTGIGLALIRRIIRRHGGRVWAESRPGEGATFGFLLPGKEKP